MILQELYDKKLLSPPKWMLSNTHYLAITGSVSYGVAENASDFDIKGVAIPPRHQVFPHEAGILFGFDEQPEFMTAWQRHHIFDKDALGGKGRNYDLSIYNIVKYFKLLMDNNPDVIDAMFVPRECILHSTEMWEIVRTNRTMFLHKGLSQKLKGYAYSQIKKANNCRIDTEEIRRYEKYYHIPHTTTYDEAKTKYSHRPTYIQMYAEGMEKSLRFEQRKIHGYDPKFLYHIYRIADQAEYILKHGDLDLQESGRREKMKAIRRGEISHDDVIEGFKTQEKRIDSLMLTSKLPEMPDFKAVKNLLLSCLESHFGSLDKCFQSDDKYKNAISEIRDVYTKWGI